MGNPYPDPIRTLSERDRPTSPLRSERWATCSECPPLTVERIAKSGNASLESLWKAYRGDPKFLRIAERQRAFEAGYDRFQPYLAEPISKDQFVKSETDKVLWLARARAKAVLELIGTPEAKAILKRGAEGAPGSRLRVWRIRRFRGHRGRLFSAHADLRSGDRIVVFDEESAAIVLD